MAIQFAIQKVFNASIQSKEIQTTDKNDKILIQFSIQAKQSKRCLKAEFKVTKIRNKLLFLSFPN